MTTHTPTPATRTGTPAATPADTDETFEIDRRREARLALRTRHSKSVAELLEERADLNGVHRLADFVAESVRWTA